MLEKMFYPASVAVIGASQEKGKVGRDVLDNLIGQFGGQSTRLTPRPPRSRVSSAIRAYLMFRAALTWLSSSYRPRSSLQAVKECGEKGIKNS